MGIPFQIFEGEEQKTEKRVYWEMYCVVLWLIDLWVRLSNDDGELVEEGKREDICG